jgi:hypothetical protein
MVTASGTVRQQEELIGTKACRERSFYEVTTVRFSVETTMKKTSALLCTAAAAMMLAGCATPNGYHTRASLMIGYYDGFYGPYPGGYWSGGYFYYLGHDRKYHRDDGRHFRHDNFSGARRFSAPDRDHHRSRDRDRDRR